MTIYILHKQTNEYDHCWYFSSKKNLDSFVKKFKLGKRKEDEEVDYSDYISEIDPVELGIF